METADDADEVTTVVVMAQSLLELAYAGRRNFVNDALFFGENWAEVYPDGHAPSEIVVVVVPHEVVN